MKKLPYIITVVFLCSFVVPASAKAPVNGDTLIIRGNVTDIHNQPLDSVKATITSNTSINEYNISKGTFVFRVPVSSADDEIQLEFLKDGFRSHTITHTIPPDHLLENINVRLYPGYRILLKGRVRVGNMPMEDVNVTIKHGEQVFNQKTLGCYYDDEDYWNCLYLGMFKADITSKDPEDSITLFFSKQGYEPLIKSLKFSEYSGELMDIKLTYADFIPDFPKHNLNLKFSPPLEPLHMGTDYNGWFLGLSYYRHLSSVSFWRRMAIGLDISMSTAEYTSEFTLLPDEETAQVDSFYIDAFAGPSVQFWLIEPEKRKFSTYIGNTLGISFKTGNLVNQPFIGTRYFLDLSKAISLEVRYLSHQIEITEFQGNMTGAAIPETKKVLNEKVMVNLGIQVIF